MFSYGKGKLPGLLSDPDIILDVVFKIDRIMKVLFSVIMRGKLAPW